MHRFNSQRAVEYYDSIARHYDADLSASAIDRLARRAFVDLVARYVASGSALLDFGCGTGLDAVSYAQRGYRVLAWDTSAGMLNECRRRCAADIADGRIAVGDAHSRLESLLDRHPPPAALVANFGVLNMIPDLQDLSALAASRLASPGWIIVSVVNPMAWHIVRRAWWWRGVAAAHAGPFPNRTDKFDSVLHFLGGIRSAASDFHLIGVGTAGACVRYDERRPSGLHLFWDDPQAGHGSVRRLLWRSPMSRFLGRFTFVVLRRDR